MSGVTTSTRAALLGEIFGGARAFPMAVVVDHQHTARRASPRPTSRRRPNGRRAGRGRESAGSTCRPSVDAPAMDLPSACGQVRLGAGGDARYGRAFRAASSSGVASTPGRTVDAEMANHRLQMVGDAGDDPVLRLVARRASPGRRACRSRSMTVTRARAAPRSRPSSARPARRRRRRPSCGRSACVIVWSSTWRSRPAAGLWTQRMPFSCPTW